MCDGCFCSIGRNEFKGQDHVQKKCGQTSTDVVFSHTGLSMENVAVNRPTVGTCEFCCVRIETPRIDLAVETHRIKLAVEPRIDLAVETHRIPNSTLNANLTTANRFFTKGDWRCGRFENFESDHHYESNPESEVRFEIESNLEALQVPNLQIVTDAAVLSSKRTF